MDEQEFMDRFWTALCRLADIDGAAPINKHTGCWEKQLDERWWFAANGHKEPKSAGDIFQKVPPFSVVVKFNGWPFAVIDPHGGCVGHGEMANTRALVKVMEKAAGIVAEVAE